jgi:two-component system, OmpR family, sensor histidine kinase ChvG
MDWLIDELDLGHGVLIGGAFMLGTFLPTVFARLIGLNWGRRFNLVALAEGSWPAVSAGTPRTPDHAVPVPARIETPQAPDARRQFAEEFRHSLKGPVETIQTSIDIIQRAPRTGSEQADRAYSLIESSLARLRRLALEEHPGFEGRERGEFGASPIDLHDAVSALGASYRLILETCGIALDYRGTAGILVAGTRVGIDVVVENLLDNAISFSPRGGTIHVRLEPQDDKVDLVIEDEGPGVDPALLERIFERSFSHRPGSPHERPQSSGEPSHSGLGLWIARHYVESLGGSVTASNLAAGGLCVRLRLPVAE